MKKEMQEIGQWLQNGNIGSSSRHLLSRVLGADAIDRPSFPSDRSDANRCLELYKSSTFVRDNIGIVYDETYLGIIPVWQILFDEIYPLFCNNTNWSWYLYELGTIKNLVPRLVHSNISYSFDNGVLTYIVSGIRYTVSNNSFSQQSLYDEELQVQSDNRMQKVIDEYQYTGKITEQMIDEVCAIGKNSANFVGGNSKTLHEINNQVKQDKTLKDYLIKKKNTNN